MSLAREIVAARRVTSSIAARTVAALLSEIIWAIAVDGAISPARHCTRIARISGGCTSSVRRLMAASTPARLLMSPRLRKSKRPPVTPILRHNVSQPVAESSHQHLDKRLEGPNGCTKIFRQAEIRESRIETRRECDAPPQERHAQIGQERKDGQEPQAGDSDRIGRSAEEGREGSPQARPKTVLVLGQVVIELPL